MQSRFSIRNWAGAILCALLCLAVQARAAAAADTSSKNSARPSSAHPVSVKHSKHKSSTGKHSRSKHSRRKTKGKRKRGQEAIDSARAQQIQEALIRQHYLDGEPSGKWDAATQDAMRRYQTDQGWQAKTVPDSRALIKLGLGPSTDGLLNPESAMTAGPLASGAKAETEQGTDPPVNPSAGPASTDPPPQ
jgi:Putative peptidoglycan binding domain